MEKKRELTNNIQTRKEGPIVGLGPYDRATAAESERSGWPLEVACDASGSRTVGRGGMRREYGDAT